MDIQILITSALTSVTVSGLLVFILETYFKTRIEHIYKIELEKYKSQLSLELGQSQAFVSRRVEAYPAIVEMVYRTRNMARDLVRSLNSRNLSLVTEAAARTKELEELLYKYRIDLERDKQFSSVHRYKNLMLTFTMKASDVKYFIEHQEEDRAQRADNELTNIYQEIENLYGSIVHELSVSEMETKDT